MKPSQELFEVIKKNFIEKDSITIDDIEVFDMRACDTSYNKSYDLYLDRQFVKGYAEYMNSGEAGLGIVHDNQSYIPLGRSIKGYGKYVFEDDSAVGKFYILKNVSIGSDLTSNDIIKSINAGITQDTSVEFSAKEIKCSICGNNILNWDECSHILGSIYNQEICYGTVKHNGAVYSNLHLVGDGSIEKAKVLLPDDSEIESRSFAKTLTVFFGKGITDKLNNKKEEFSKKMGETENKDYSSILKSVEAIQLSIDKNKELVAEMESLKIAHDEEIGSYKSKIDNLSDELVEMAKFKDAYFAILEEEGIKAYGKEFDKIVFENKTISQLEEARTKFKELSKKNVNIGKVDTDTGEFVYDDSNCYKLK